MYPIAAMIPFPACTNEKSNTVTVLSVDSTKIKDTGERIAMKAPICVTVN